MQQEGEYEYGEIDKKKVAFAVLALFAVLAAVVAVIYLCTDKTKASTEVGTAVISPERIQQISDEISEDVLDTIRTEILADMVSQSVEKELTGERIYETVTEPGSEVRKLAKKEIRTVAKEFVSKELASKKRSSKERGSKEQAKEEALSEKQTLPGGQDLREGAGESGSEALTEKQKAEIRSMLDQSITAALASVDVNRTLSAQEKNAMMEQLRQRLSKDLQSQLQNSSAKWTSQDLEKIKNSLHIEKLVKSSVKSMTDKEIEKLSKQMAAKLEKNIKSSSKNYLTKAQAEKLQEKILKQAAKELIVKTEELSENINLVKSSVNELTARILELKTWNDEKTADLSTMQHDIQEINRLITEINSVTKELTKSIMVVNKDLEKVTADGSALQSQKASTANMTVAEFVDVLAGNDKAYTAAIQELNKLVGELKEENKNQDTAFEKSVKELEQSLNKNGEELEQFKIQQEKKDEEWDRQMQQQTQQQGSQLKDQAQKQEQQLKDQAQRQEQQLKDQAQKQEQMLKEEQKIREEEDKKLQSRVDETNALIGDKETAGKIEGDTIFEKIGSIVKILSSNGLSGLLDALKNVGGAKTLEEGVTNIHTDLTDARARVGELEKEKWLADITLLADASTEKENAYAYQESGSAYAYQIPLVTEQDQIDLDDASTAIVIDFKSPDKLPSHAAFSTSSDSLFITFTNKPARNIEIVSIHVYKQR